MVYCVLLWFASIIIPGGFITWITFSWNGFPMQFLGTNLKMNCNNWTVLHLKQLSGLVISRIGEEQQHVNQTMFHSVSQMQWYLDKSKTFVTFVWTNPTHARHAPMHTLITHLYDYAHVLFNLFCCGQIIVIYWFTFICQGCFTGTVTIVMSHWTKP